MIDPLEVYNAYVKEQGFNSQPEAVSLPQALAITLPARVRGRNDGTLDAAEWRGQNEDWCNWADTQYRACVARRSLNAKASPIRVGVKDTIDVAGFATRLGLRHYRHYPTRTAPVARIKNPAVAAITTKVVTTELNVGVGSGCINPYARHISPGGSSTGVAVAVAANICDIGLGTDVLGSIRWPAGNCGVVGLRMTWNKNKLEGVFPLSPIMDALGWVTRSVSDLVFLWPVLHLGCQIAKPQRCRVAIVSNVLDEGACHPEMLDALNTAGRYLRDAGHEIVTTRLDDLWPMRGLAWQLCARQAWDGYKLWQQHIQADISDSTLLSFEVGARVTDDSHRNALNALTDYRRKVDQRFEVQDEVAWLLPLHPTPPRDLRTAPHPRSTIPSPTDPDYEERIGYTPIASWTGLPAITLPIKRSRVNGAPLAVQIVGRPHGEESLIALAAELEEVAGPLGWALT